MPRLMPKCCSTHGVATSRAQSVQLGSWSMKRVTCVHERNQHEHDANQHQGQDEKTRLTPSE
jgi:hypothetical protein